MTMNKFHFNEHKQDTWKCDWLICHIISIRYTVRGRPEFINPFAANDRSIGGSGNELPCLIEQECGEFAVHGGHLCRMFGGGEKCGWLKRERGRGVKAHGKRIWR